MVYENIEYVEQMNTDFLCAQELALTESPSLKSLIQSQIQRTDHCFGNLHD
jgi:hypothetical protein